MAETEAHTQFKVTYYDSRQAGRLALVTMDNGRDHTKPNTFGEHALESLDAALEEIESQSDVKGLLLTGKPFIFAVGADLDQFPGADEAFARRAGEEGHRAFRRLAGLPFPTLAAINGACMGGGLEIALHCDYRTLSTGATVLAFPEVFLSILPAWGGTQLAPRIVGAEAALQTIITDALNNNTTMRPKQAFERGFADHFLPSVDFLERSRELLEALIVGDETIEREPPSTDGLDEALGNARAFVDAKVHGATRAPYVAIDLIEFAARGGDLDEGYRREEDALAELLPAPQAQASVYAFNLTQQRVKRQPWRPDAEPRSIRKVAIIGSGLMGAQLGALFLQRFEVPLVMKDIDQEVLDRARDHIEGELDKRVQKGRLKEGRAEFLKRQVTYTLDYADVAGADWVIEAVLERMDLKKAIFADLEQVLDDGAVLATNTSSLSIAGMAADLDHPERVVGFHFFNPVNVLPLVEVVRAKATSDEAAATAFEVAKTLRKSAVQCADAPAFVVNRLLSRFMGACIGASRHGNGFKEIDAAILELGLPMGPFTLLGLVGPAVALHTVETLHEHFPERFPVDDDFRAFVELGLPGVYDWDRGGEPYEQVLELWHVDEDAEPLTGDEIRRRALEAVADEAKRMLDEGVVADARDIDTCLLLGAGWPFFLGGICKHLDQIGLTQELFGTPLIGSTDEAT